MEIVKGGMITPSGLARCRCYCEIEDQWTIAWQAGHDDSEHCGCRCSPLAAEWHFTDAWVYMN
jgi:hypothetical protein